MERRGELKPFYYQWLEKEGIPVYQGGQGVEDITQLPRRPWARLGGKGTFIELEPTKAEGSLLYVAEIPAGGHLAPEKHLYNEISYILRGRGLTEVWPEGQGKVSFEWGEGSLFAMPMNAWHRLVNGGRQPVLIFAKTGAPSIMQTFRNTDFVFNCPYNFTDRFTGQADYFLASNRQYRQETPTGETRGTRWETNFVPDVRTIAGDYLSGWKVEGGRQMYFEMADWGGVHASEWPAGIYHKAHYHGPGPVLLGLKSDGFVLLWHKQFGIHPFQEGHADKVVKMKWKPGSIYSPGRDWFHQHFNTGRGTARQLALRAAHQSGSTEREDAAWSTSVSVRDGGALINYEDEDPQIRRLFQEALRENGVEFAMAPVVYRTDPFRLPWL